MEVMLDIEQIQAIFLFKFKTGHKAAVITHNINNAFGPGIANESIVVQWWFKKFCKGECIDAEVCTNKRLRCLCINVALRLETTILNHIKNIL